MKVEVFKKHPTQSSPKLIDSTTTKQNPSGQNKDQLRIKGQNKRWLSLKK